MTSAWQFARNRMHAVPFSNLGSVGALCSSVEAREPVEPPRHGGCTGASGNRCRVQVLRNGGNAVDAPSRRFALAVTYPYAGNLGGGGFMLIRFADGRSTSSIFASRAPRSLGKCTGCFRKPTARAWTAEVSGVPARCAGSELAIEYGSRKVGSTHGTAIA